MNQEATAADLRERLRTWSDRHPIRAYRQTQRLSLEMLAGLLGMSYSTLRQWERGYIDGRSFRLNQEKFAGLCAMMNVTPAHLLADIDAWKIAGRKLAGKKEKGNGNNDRNP